MMRPYAFLWFALAGLAASAWPVPCGAHALSAAAAAYGAAFVAPPDLPPGGSYTPLGDAMRLQGRPVFAWLLDAPGSIRDIASWLTARQPALRDLWVTPGAIVLAGITEGMHWAARLSDAGAGRTRGTISALPTDLDAPSDVRGGARAAESARGGAGPARADARMPGSGGATPAADPGWRLPGGQLHFEFRSRDEGASIIEQLWTHAVPPAALRKQLFADLVADGWRPADTGDPGVDALWAVAADVPQATPYWSRGRMTLSVVIVPLDQGSGITTIVRIGA